MRITRILVSLFILLFGTATIQAENTEWETLIENAISFGEQGKTDKAIEIAKKALSTAEKAFGNEHPNLAMSLLILGKLYSKQGQYVNAEPLYQQALIIQEKSLGPEHPAVARNLNILADLYRVQGQYEKAVTLNLRALTIRENVLGPDHPDVANSLDNLAVVYQVQGQYTKAESLHLRALVIYEKSLGHEHPDVAINLNNLATLYNAQGQYSKAESLYQKALPILEKSLGPEHLDVATSLNNLAELYTIQGKYDKAEPLYQRALAIREKVLGSEHPAVATSLSNSAVLYKTQGQYSKAESLYLRALAIQEKTLGFEHPNEVNTLNNLANLYQAQYLYTNAESMYRRALAIIEKTFGPEHPSVSLGLNNLALLYQNQGQYGKAESLMRRALAIGEKAFGPEHPSVAVILNNLAVLYYSQGQYNKANPINRQTLAIWEKSLGSEHPHVAGSLQSSALNLWSQGGTANMSLALEQFERSNTIRKHHLKLMMVKGSEQDKLDYMTTIAQDMHIVTSFHRTLPGNAQAARLALSTVLQHKGRLLDAVTHSIGVLRQRMNPEDQVLLDQLKAINGERSDLFNRVQYGKIDRDAYLKLKQELETQADALEAKISSRSAEFTAKIQSITLAAVQQAIPQDAVLVEYLLYWPLNPKTSQKERQYGPAHYIAYLLRSTGDPVSVELGDAAVIDDLVAQFRSALANQHDDSISAIARKLDAAIMQPVRKLAGDTRTLLVSPDGALNLIPFAALQDEQNRYLIENYRFNYLSSGRDLLRLDVPVGNLQPPVFFAGVDFGTSSGKDIIAMRAPSKGKRASDYQQQFAALPGTREEAEAIRQILPVATLFSGQDATEARLKKLDRPQILHLATHGFFLTDLPESAKPSRGVSLMGVADKPVRNHQPAVHEDPLLRSGLALANANRLQSGDEDGLLTALEVTGLDLWGTRLVVLSACETGVGEIQNGQGVFGLRRALVIAGSETQVMSLWKVDDDGTKDLMVDYYQRLLKSEGRSEAMRQAQLAMLHGPHRHHPFYWASFIVSGDWKPMERSK